MISPLARVVPRAVPRLPHWPTRALSQASSAAAKPKKPMSTKSKVYLGACGALALYWGVLHQKEEWVKHVKLSKRLEEGLIERLQLSDPCTNERQLKKELRNLRALFASFSDDQGRIPVTKLDSTLFVLYFEPTGTIDLRKVFDRDGNGYVNFQEFIYGVCMLRRFQEVTASPEDQALFLRLMFSLVDFENNNCIGQKELVSWVPAAVALSLIPDEFLGAVDGKPASPDVVAERLLARFDADGDSVLSFEEWSQLHSCLNYCHYVPM